MDFLKKTLAPRTQADAIRQANRLHKAKQMKAEGYQYNELARKMYRIFKPENQAQNKADYIVDLMVDHCTCEDFAKYTDCCKHTLFVKVELEREYREEEEGFMKAALADYELRAQYEG